MSIFLISNAAASLIAFRKLYRKLRISSNIVMKFCCYSQHHEWPRRSLIDDARKDSLVNQTFEGLRDSVEEEEEEEVTHVIVKLDRGVGIADVLNKFKVSLFTNLRGSFFVTFGEK